ncbi:BTBD3_6 [Lepeophtheirus salmonis]|uniref:BTBD3_6 n=1 Tax=Lepeophtheirus salmonis TaxID=72036 RepID=A0A7R8CR77_LEPSM|nr:BTBD3_6 [Lepeophtheirus salmonis]CAF2902682.1 BTBD3_6 [Lepeophtheirus salmonis]
MASLLPSPLRGRVPEDLREKLEHCLIEEPENQERLPNGAQSGSDSYPRPLNDGSSGHTSPSTPCSSSSASATTSDPDWQSTKKSLKERSAVMFNNPTMADVYFLIGSKGRSSTNPCSQVHHGNGQHDVEPAAFLVMLKYLYCDEITLEPENVLPTLYCSKKYIVPHLAKECVSFLETSLTADNACVLLSESRLFEEPHLMQRCWEVIDAQASMALLAESFSDIDVDTLKKILSRETLNCKETVVFKAALSWASARIKEEETAESESVPVKKREILGSALNLIRFPAMSVNDFADEIVTSGILNLREITDIFLHFTSKKFRPKIDYPLVPRKGLEIIHCHRFLSSAYRSNQWRYRGRCDSIQFCVDKRIFVVGYGLYGSSNGASEYSAKIELKSSCGGKSLAESSVKFFSDGSNGDELSYFGQEGTSEMTVGGVTFQFQCSSESTNGTGVQGGQIPELLLYGPSD